MTRADVMKFPESRLFYPGSRVVRVVGADQTPTRRGEEPNPAYSGAILTTTADAQSVYAWYSAQLARMGWTPAADFRPSTQVSGMAWQQHHRLQVQVGVFDPQSLARDMGVVAQVPGGGVVYEEVLVGYPPGLPRD